ncbi:MAG: hypothetical protein R2856_23410 [Caldilineaceae bacterium]
MTIFDPFTLPISAFLSPNRLALAPMTTYSSHEDGTITDEEVTYLRRRAAVDLARSSRRPVTWNR